MCEEEEGIHTTADSQNIQTQEALRSSTVLVSCSLDDLAAHPSRYNDNRHRTALRPYHLATTAASAEEEEAAPRTYIPNTIPRLKSTRSRSHFPAHTLLARPPHPRLPLRSVQLLPPSKTPSSPKTSFSPIAHPSSSVRTLNFVRPHLKPSPKKNKNKKKELHIMLLPRLRPEQLLLVVLIILSFTALASASSPSGPAAPNGEQALEKRQSAFEISF